MVYLQIHKQEYSLKTDWQEITIAEAVKLQELQVPEHLLTLIMTGKDDVTNSDIIKTFPDFFGKVIYVLSNIPMNVIDKVHASDRAGIYTEYLKQLMTDLVSMNTEPQPLIDFFEFNGVTYHLPHTEQVFGKQLPFYGMEAISFTEMADLQLAVTDLQSGGLKAASMLVAVATRSAGKSYDEKEAIRLSKEFEQLPMSIFWQVFFSFNQALVNCLNQSLQYLTELHNQQTEQLKKLTARHSGVTSLKSRVRGWLARFNKSKD